MKLLKASLKIVLIVLLSVFAYSCLEDPVEPVYRTEANELAELNTLILSLEEDYNVDTTDLGLYYIKLEDGLGMTPVEGDSIRIKYTGYFTNGTVFDSSIKSSTDTTYNFRYKVSRMVEGFEDGLALMNVGSDFTMIIRSSLGYGPYDYYTIPGYSTIIFDVELVEIVED